MEVLVEWMFKSLIHSMNINDSTTICQELFYLLGYNAEGQTKALNLIEITF